MTVSILDLHCLNSGCDDYETFESITAEVCRSSHGSVHDDEVTECLAEMAAAGLGDVFHFDADSGSYKPLPSGVVTRDAIQQRWFLINPKGRQELNANWVEY